MIVNYLNTAKVSKKTRDEIQRVMECALDYLGQKALCEINITFVSPEEIREVNKNQRDKDAPTDVLSFPCYNFVAGQVIDMEDSEFKYNINPENEAFSLGDMLLCIDVAKEQAKSFGHSLEAELVRLSLHSVLHCLGYDHIEDKDFEVMHPLEMEISKKCGYTFEE